MSTRGLINFIYRELHRMNAPKKEEASKAKKEKLSNWYVHLAVKPFFVFKTNTGPTVQPAGPVVKKKTIQPRFPLRTAHTPYPPP